MQCPFPLVQYKNSVRLFFFRVGYNFISFACLFFINLCNCFAWDGYFTTTFSACQSFLLRFFFFNKSFHRLFRRFAGFKFNFRSAGL